MSGEITTENANYYLSENQTGFSETDIQEKNIIHRSWIYALEFSKLYIAPDEFLIEVKKKKVGSNNKIVATKNNKTSHAPNEPKFEYTQSFIDEAFSIFELNKHLTYKLLKQKLEFKYEKLKNETLFNFKDICMMAFARKLAHEKQKKAFFGTQKSKQKIETHYQWKMSNPSGNLLKRPGFWSANETENLIIILEEGYKQDNIFKQN